MRDQKRRCTSETLQLVPAVCSVSREMCLMWVKNEINVRIIILRRITTDGQPREHNHHRGLI